MNNIAPIVAGFLSGLIGAMGFGGGGILIIYLTLLANTPQVVAQGINLLFFIPCATVATIIYLSGRKIDIKTILPVIAGGVTGAYTGSLLINSLKSQWLSQGFALFLIITGIINLSRLMKTEK